MSDLQDTNRRAILKTGAAAAATFPIAALAQVGGSGEIKVANTFDEAKVDWKPLPNPDGKPTEHVSMSFLNIDREGKIVDILFKFSANEKIPMHRHTSNYSTFTVKGELRTYDTNGNLQSVRPAGVFKAGTPGEAHTEGGGNEDVVVYFSLRPYTSTDPIYEILDENLEVVADMCFDDLEALYKEHSK